MGAQVSGAAAPSHIEQLSGKNRKKRSNEEKIYSMGDFGRSKAPFTYKKAIFISKIVETRISGMDLLLPPEHQLPDDTEGNNTIRKESSGKNSLETDRN